MPIFRLNKELSFPDPSLAEDEGILAIGGDLSVDRLILAYANGIFPWPSKGAPVLWWSPDPRMVLFPENFKVSHSLRQLIRSGKYSYTIDQDFTAVIKNCANIPRKGQDYTWITDEMIKAYIKLHREGFAHSVETRQDGKLIGGLYGVSIGRAFFGESMFFHVSDASKFAIYQLVKLLKHWNFQLIDAQQDTEHMRSLGAINIPRDEFMERLEVAIAHPTYKGNWNNYL
ncbi:MAG: leucyl/phenylalanyl-tRNA--protein transferase [Bacteroidales bacterium]|nr:leucyl/phenylalanyl-tRNA--protein transferase [Bacteroidales bacterium]